MRLIVFAALALTAATGAAQTGGVIRLDPALDKIVPPDAKVEKLGGDFGFTEGPLWLPSGSLIFSDIPKNLIRQWTPDGKLGVYGKPDAFSGPNGLAFDKDGRLVVCEQIGRRLVRMEKNGAVTVLAERFEGKRLNSPNDVVLRKADGALYFTDPPYGLPKQDQDPAKEVPFNGVYRLAGGNLQILEKTLSRPNGIAFSPDQKYLYVAETKGGRTKVWMRYDVKPDGSLANGKVFADATGDRAPGGPDGMKVDRRGNLYCTAPGGIWIISPEGKHLGTIQAPEVAANCAWGDKDYRTLYITARTGLYRIRLLTQGVQP